MAAIVSASEWKHFAHQREALAGGVYAAFELRIFHGGENGGEDRPGTVSRGDQVCACHQRLRLQMLVGKLPEFTPRQFITLQPFIAGHGVEAMQFQVLQKSGHAEEALHGALPHVRQVFELHVIGDQGLHLLDLVVGEPQAGENLVCQMDALFHMAIEANAIGHAEGWRLADIVQQRNPAPA